MKMKSRALALVAMIAAVTTFGCNSFLTCDKCIKNPNLPTSASADQLFIGVQVATMAQWETYPLNLLPTWVDQIAGVNRQWANYADYASGTDNITSDATWISMYGPGGLADLRRAEDEATLAGNLKEVGELKVFEALLMGTSADLFGSIPYDSALTTEPKFDAQADVYTHVQATLDTAISDLASGGTGTTVDFFYANDFAKWTAAAHTLKARFFMHTAENGDLSYDNTKLNSVLTETALGISNPSGDLATQHTSNSLEANLFYEFLVGSRAGDVEPAQLHISLLQALNDNVLLASLYSAPYSGSSAGVSAGSHVSSFRVGPTTQMIIVGNYENLLLSAEAHFRLGAAGTAATELQTEHSNYGEPGSAPIVGGTNGLLVTIINEKFARGFLNPEIYFDYLRTCVPNIPLPANIANAFTAVPARFNYGFTEEVTNTKTPADPIANGNWPKHLTSASGAACFGQKDRVGT
ncbi:MAG TPA: SusD/RagB family nutrient-binding outer membrane lipoprotein [Gemmatimonadaceae bacterium]|nr:SusD/RagB family nutrient-binding outer membrane lipoprotein [Gemmatimonadaceae bacterium]